MPCTQKIRCTHQTLSVSVTSASFLLNQASVYSSQAQGIANLIVQREKMKFIRHTSLNCENQIYITCKIACQLQKKKESTEERA
jgi:hypothetical protein